MAAQAKPPPSKDRDNTVSLWTGCVRMEGKFANQVENDGIEPSKFLQEMYDAVKSRVDPDFHMGDKLGNMFAMDGIPETYNACIDKFNLQVKKGAHQHLMFVFMIQSTHPCLGVIKNACFHVVLKQPNLYLHAHPFSPEKLALGLVGFILGVNIHYHSPEKQHTKIQMEIQRCWWWDKLDDGAKSIWKNCFKSSKTGSDVIPDFFIAAKLVKACNALLRRAMASANALLVVMTPLEHIRAMMSILLEEVFAPPEDDCL
eukprot:scaffold273_cov89-Cylindrotheca_fusiformis.AAC.5